MQASIEPPVIETLQPSRRFFASARYFFFFAAVAGVSPFLVLYLQSLGFSGAQIGLLTSLGPLLGLFATPFWTGLADASNQHKRILIGAVTVMVAMNILLPFLRTFSLVFAVQVILALFTSHALALQDSATIHMLGKQRDRYGRIRLWGTIGWGVSAPIVGVLLGYLGLAAMFWIFVVLMSFNLLLLRDLSFDQASDQSAYLKRVGQLLKDSQWLLFLVAAMMGGLGMAAHGNYLPLLVQQTSTPAWLLVIAASASAVVGIALTVSTIFEAPVMLAASRLLRWLGSWGALFAALALIGVRNLMYANVTDSGQIVLVQVLHGLTYPLLWLAGVAFVAAHAPRGLNATAQGVFSAVLSGIGTASGNYFCGWLIDRVGIHAMFNLVGWLGLGTMAVFFVLSRVVRRTAP